MQHIRSRRRMVSAVAVVLVLAPAAFAARTQIKPGWNLFSPQQDIEVGRKVSQDAEKQLAMLNDRRVDDYLNRLGRRLAAKAPGEKYPYQFKAVNDAAINAFALPGGFLYVNRGTIEAADNEAQLAGVIGHEIAHVALRHGTNQASKAYAAQAPLALLGGILGSNSIGSVLAQVGAGFAANSVLLKYSRDAERQADIIGTQILYDNNYDPRELARFFQKLESGGRGPEFFSSHPSPENRITLIDSEISKLGGQQSYRNDSAEFRDIRNYVRSLPAAPRSGARQTTGRGETGTIRTPDRPSSRVQNYSNNSLSLSYPDNWRAYNQGDSFTLAPEGGIGSTNGSDASLAYGVMMAVFEPQSGSRTRSTSLEQATDQLINSLQNANPGMQVSRDGGRIRVGGQQALSTYISNESPTGGREQDWLVTVQRPEGLVYFVFVAPEREYRDYQRTFENIVSSIRFSQ